MASEKVFLAKNEVVTPNDEIDFAEVKSQFFLPEAISAALGTSYKSCGTDLYQLDPTNAHSVGIKDALSSIVVISKINISNVIPAIVGNVVIFLIF